MPSAREGAEVPTTLAAEGDELGRAHLARWLDTLLPAGPCLVWGGGETLASVLAADRRRTVLLVEPRQADLEVAARRPQAGVALGGPDAVGRHERFDSGVIAADGEDPGSVLASLLDGVLAEAPLAVITAPGGADAVVAVLEQNGRPATVVRQGLRLASVLRTGEEPAVAEALAGPADSEPTASVVLTGVDASPSVLVGRDAGAAARWPDVEWIRRSLRAVDIELRAADAVRLSELDDRLEASKLEHEQLRQRALGLEQRIDDLQSSTSWRVSAPLRWLSDRARRR